MTYAHPPASETLLQHAGFVRGVARALVRGDADVDDVVQATWLSVLEGGPKRPLPVRGWLATVVRRRAADLHRSRARVTRREQAAARPEATSATVDLAAKAELGRRMVGAVLSLDEPYRSAILLRYYEDLPPREVAKRLAVPVETARTRVKRGLVKLREHFDREEGGDRRAWMTAYLPLAHVHAVVPAAAAAVGSGTLLKLALAALLVVGALVVWRGTSEPPLSPPLDNRETNPDPILRGRAAATVLPVAAESSPVRGVIEGLVLRGDQPVAVRVELRRLDDRSEGAPLLVPHPDWLYGDVVGAGRPLASTSSSADGRFAFADVGTGIYDLRAVDGPRIASLRVPLRATRPARPLRLRLPAGQPLLEGRAVHADGRPFRGWIRPHTHAGASVTLAPFGVDLVYGDGLVPVDAEGRFEVHGVSPGAVHLAAFRPGEVRYLSGPVVVPYQGTFTFVVDEGVSGVEGRVVTHDGGRPIADAVVTASALAGTGEGAWARVRTNAAGRFSLALPDRDLAVSVSAGGYVDRRCGTPPTEEVEYTAYGRATIGGGPSFAPLERAADGRVLVRLVSAPRLSGRVHERGTGRALSGITVYAVAADFAASGSWARATTLPDGSFRFAQVQAGPVTVFAAGAGWISAEVAEATAARVGSLTHRLEPGRTTEVVLEVVPAVRASGRVVDARGAPVVGAAVRAQPTSAFPPLETGSPTWLGATVTDADGRFRLDPLVAGYGYRFYAQPPEGVLTTTEVIAVGPEGVENVEIQVPDAVWLNVRAIDDVTGGGVANAQVKASGGRGANYLLARAFRTGVDGRVRVGPVPAVEWIMLTARAAGYLRDHDIPSSIDVRKAVEEEISIRLHPGRVITGRVVVPQEISTAGLLVHVSPASGGHRRSNHPYRVRADATGAFRVDGVAPDLAYTISSGVRRGLSSYVAEVTTEAGDTSVELHLALDTAETAWALTVLDAQGQLVPAAAARLHIRMAEGGDETENGTVDGGSVVLRTRSPVAEAWVSVHGARDAAGLPLAAGACYRHDLPVNGGEVELRLDAPRRIAGVVKGTNGSGVPDVVVYAHRAFDPPPRWRRTREHHERAETDGDGAFALEHLGDGDYLLVLVCPGTHRDPEPVTVGAGQDDVVIVLEDAVQPRVVVRDEDGTAVVGANVVALPANPPPGARAPDPAARTGADGVAVLPALVPGEACHLRIDPPPERGDLARFDDRSWIPGDREVVLALAAAIAGRVVDQAGDPFPKAHVLWRVAGGTWEAIATGDDAAFRLLRLPRDRTYELHARGGFAGGGEPSPDAIVRVRPGEEHVVLQARRPLEVVVRVEGWPRDVEGVMGYLRPEGGYPMVTVVQADGTARYADIAATQPLTFYAGPLPDGRYAQIDRIVPGTDSPIATLHPGLEIHGRLRLPPGATKTHVWLTADGMSIGASNALSADGTFVFRGLYPGTWTVNASAKVDGTWIRAVVPVAAGITDVLIIAR